MVGTSLMLSRLFVAVAVLDPRYFAVSHLAVALPPRLLLYPLGQMLGYRCSWFTLQVLCRHRCPGSALWQILCCRVCAVLSLRLVLWPPMLLVLRVYILDGALATDTRACYYILVRHMYLPPQHAHTVHTAVLISVSR
jgi:hypothetical protein